MPDVGLLDPLIRLVANSLHCSHQTSTSTSVHWRIPRYWRTSTLTHSSTPTLMQRALDLIQVVLHTLQMESKRARTVCKFGQKLNSFLFSQVHYQLFFFRRSPRRAINKEGNDTNVSLILLFLSFLILVFFLGMRKERQLFFYSLDLI